MAQRTQIMLIDDIDETEATETVKFGLDGVTYEIDLSEENAAKLRSSFVNWTGPARRTGRATSVRRTSAKTSTAGRSTEHLAAVRAWAKENGHVVADRGRVSQSVQDAYDQAHK